jgi:pantetheine-phosphate adenylyltransferase
MKRVAIYPGSFDPLTNGHLDLIRRGLRTFDKVIIGIGVHNKKTPLFSLEEREALIHASINHIEHLGLITETDSERIKVVPFTNLVVEFAHDVGAQFIIRGIRNNSDFEYEFAFAHINTRMAPELEHIYFMSGEPDHFVSSSIVKELWSFGNNYRNMVPEPVFRALENKRR